MKALLALATVIFAACASTARDAGSSRAEVGWTYFARVEPAARALVITVEFEDAFESFTVEERTVPFLRDVEGLTGGEWRPLSANDGTWRLATGSETTRRLRYRFLLARAAESIDDTRVIGARHGAFVARPSTWLLRPVGEETHSVRIAVEAPSDVSIATGLFRGKGGAYEVPSWMLPYAPFTAFGAFRTRLVKVGHSEIEVAITPDGGALPLDRIVAWIEDAAGAVAGYYDGFPVPRALVYVSPRARPGLGVASAYGYGGAGINVPFGSGTSAEDLADDWVMAHEMVHLGAPSLGVRWKWLAEGLATYVEPVARARSGSIDEERLWSELVLNLPEGQPAAGDRGLDHTPTWGRTYWGGALFCFVADVEIRRRTGNRRGLEHALRALVSEGGSIAAPWTVEETLAVCDLGTGARVLTELYDAMKATPVRVDLAGLWRSLGVRRENGRTVFDDDAPEAAIRRAIAGESP